VTNTTKKGSGGFIGLPYSVYDGDEFQALKPMDVVVLLLLIRKWNGHNNGNIALGVREAANRCHCSQMTACRALKNLEKARIITATYKGHLVPEVGRSDVATRWKLNFVTETKNRYGANVVRLTPLPK
jgi:hypothetical protein